MLSDFHTKKIATGEEVLIGMVSMLSVGILIGYLVVMNIEKFADPRIKECIQKSFYE